ncbi:hypothetical protein KAM338_23780 [Aeromonas caviae]|uniref:hypothetical protein n=1 Tax=Aeromonas hydrophila TaxID=644 RepID=UPI00167FFC38|nr:hypothetical protein [Aeromonas hydrophila]BCK65764.1 hypothetical protein KAM330_47530 [Aeromonas hydrophila]GKQ62201.1 hypothetical protein KAM338_23780 [Aeromonas caviae]
MTEQNLPPSFKNFVGQNAVIDYGYLENGDTYAITRLMFHVALYVNPTADGLYVAYDARYCYCNLMVAMQAVAKFNETQEWWWYQKDHKRNRSVEGRFLVNPAGALERILPWDANLVREGDLTELSCEDEEAILATMPFFITLEAQQ